MISSLLRQGYHSLKARLMLVGILASVAISVMTIGSRGAIAAPTSPAFLLTTPTLGQLSTPADSTQVSEKSSEDTSASTLFELNCAGCHINGGNIIRRGKNLQKKAMVRNGYGEVDAIATIITNGKGNLMSAYGDRLTEDEIGALAQYVHEQSEAGW